MAKRQGKSSKAATGKSSKKKSPHPGGSEEEAKAVGGKLDFGTAESDRTERTYTSLNTKRSDPGSAVVRAGSEGSRISGVGGNESGPGSSSGGDLDPDIIGFGTGGGVAASGKIHEPRAPTTRPAPAGISLRARRPRRQRGHRRAPHQRFNRAIWRRNDRPRRRGCGIARRRRR